MLVNDTLGSSNRCRDSAEAATAAGPGRPVSWRAALVHGFDGVPVEGLGPLLGDDLAGRLAARARRRGRRLRSTTTSSAGAAAATDAAAHRRHGSRQPASGSRSVSPMPTATAAAERPCAATPRPACGPSRAGRRAALRYQPRRTAVARICVRAARRVQRGPLLAARVGRVAVPRAGAPPDLRRVRLGAAAAGAADVRRGRDDGRRCGAGASPPDTGPASPPSLFAVVFAYCELIDAALYLNHYWS